MAQTFRCTLVTPERQALDEEVVYASLPAFDGQLGVAPQRAALVARLGDGLLRLDLARGETRWFFIAGGFAQMKDNHLTLLTSQALAAEEVDEHDVQNSRAQAQEVRGGADAQVERRDRLANRTRHLQSLLEHQRHTPAAR